MMREQKIVFLTSLTFFLVAFITFLEKSIFVFPFPLNESILFGVSLFFLKINLKKAHKKNIFIFSLATFFLMLSQNFIWTVFLSSELLTDFFNSPIQDIFAALYLVFFLYFSYLFFSNEYHKSKLILPIVIIFYVLILMGLVFTPLNFIAILLIAITGYIFKIKDPVYNLLVLFFILNSMKVFTFLVYS
tara:strand:- start:2764 stop:3330 length:567 start_codon:yes stop_codon:yes gene_type:complete